MKLVFNCGSCKEINNFKPKFTDRGLLQEAMGDEVKVNCMKCGKIENKHVNKIKAVVDMKMIYLAIIMSVLLTSFLLFYVGLIATVTFTLPMVAWLYEYKSANLFNRYRIRRR